MIKPAISIIVVDYKKNNPYLVECLEAIKKQSYKDFEIILVTDYPVKLKYPKLVKKSFGQYVGPAEKRNWGAKRAGGKILAFIDDDAYPSLDWLKNLIQHFSDKNVIAVGGPGVTPKGVSWQEEASGWASASPMGAGPYTYRFLPGKKQSVDDYPSMNLAVHRADFLSVDGYNSSYWPGEDTKLCLDLIRKSKKKIIYDPKVIVYHHRRPLWKSHLRQNGNFGLHRGYFARILPQTSFRPVYLGPPFMVCGIFYLILSSIVNFPLSIFHWLSAVGYLLFALYLFAIAGNSMWVYRHSKSLFQGIISFPSVFVTHLWYGIRFLQGFFLTTKLSR